MGKTIRVPTADYLDAYYPNYAMTNLTAVFIDQLRPGCTPVLPTVPNGKLLVVVDSSTAFTRAGGGCHDFRYLADHTHTALAVDMSALVFVNSDPHKRGHNGGPRKYFMSDGVHLPDKAPPFVTVFVNNPNSRNVVAFLKAANGTVVTAGLVQDIGPWNRAIRSPGYRLARWSIVVYLILLLLYSTFRLGRLVYRGHFDFQRPTIWIYVACMVATGALIGLVLVTPQSAAYYLLNIHTNILCIISLLLCLVIWTRRLVQLGVKTLAAPLLPFIYISMAVHVVGYFVYLITILTPKNPYVKNLDALFGTLQNLTVLVLLLSAVVFMVAALQFYHHVGDLTASSKRHLTKLTVINAMAAALFLFGGVTMFLRTADKMNPDKVSHIMPYYLSNYLRQGLRVGVVLVLLPIGQPSQRTSLK